MEYVSNLVQIHNLINAQRNLPLKREILLIVGSGWMESGKIIHIHAKLVDILKTMLGTIMVHAIVRV